MPHATQQTLFHSDAAPSPLGRISLVASITNGRGIVPPRPYRIYGSYALVIITEGQGFYEDANGCSAEICAGDAIFVHPTLPHSYRPTPGSTWNEFYLIFSGPAFDAWQTLGMFDPKRPIYPLSPLEDWLTRFRSLTLPAPEPAGMALQVCRLLTLLTEIVLRESGPSSVPGENLWLTQACSLLGGSLDQNFGVEALIGPLGMSYETFRRRFTRESGISPARFRTGRRIEAACHLLQYTGMTGAEIAERLHFSDEYHFSRRFKQVRGETPTQFRRRLLR